MNGRIVRRGSVHRCTLPRRWIPWRRLGPGSVWDCDTCEQRWIVVSCGAGDYWSAVDLDGRATWPRPPTGRRQF
jgi:hypothetical protein